MKSLVMALFALPAIALAAPPPQPVQLVSSIMVERTETVGGRTQTVLRAPEKVVPGDRLVFQITYKNGGPKPATNVVVTNPVPAGVAFGGVSTPGALMSVDGGRTFGPIGTLKIKGADGQLRAAQPNDVTTLRWTVASIAPGTSDVLKFRGVVR